MYNNNYLGHSGGVFSIFGVNFLDYRSTFLNNTALLGGSIHCGSCTLRLVEPKFDLNFAKYGGTIYVGGDAMVTITNGEFTSNYASK